MPKLVDLTNKRFEKLLVLRRCGSSNTGEPMWLCRCDCGTIKRIRGKSMQQGKTTSCGCANREIVRKQFTKYGLSTSIERNSWYGMTQRCYNPKHKSYANYGGRGITVCKEWYDPNDLVKSFLNFYNDMAPRPGEEYTLDRKDNSKGYSKDNCVWSTNSIQELNKRKRKNTTTKYKGVYYNPAIHSKPYYAQLMHKYLGSFKTPEDAARAYDKEFERLYPEAAKYGTNKGLGLLGDGIRRIVLKPEYQSRLDEGKRLIS